MAELSPAPLVASHSGAHALCPSPRNLDDDQLRAIGASGGLVGINFHVGFLRSDGADDADTPLSTIAAHAAHVAELAGVDAVALGSDFDGATMPAPLGDVTGLPALLDALRAAGFARGRSRQGRARGTGAACSRRRGGDDRPGAGRLGSRRARARCRRSRARSAPRSTWLAHRAAELGLEAELVEHDLAALRAHPGHPGEEAPRTELLTLA